MPEKTEKREREREERARSGAPFKFIRKLLPANQGRRAGLLRGCATCTHTIARTGCSSSVVQEIPSFRPASSSPFSVGPPRGETRERHRQRSTSSSPVVRQSRQDCLADRRESRHSRGGIARGIARGIAEHRERPPSRAAHARSRGTLSPSASLCAVPCVLPNTDDTRGRLSLSLGIAHTVACTARWVSARPIRARYTQCRRGGRGGPSSRSRSRPSHSSTVLAIRFSFSPLRSTWLYLPSYRPTLHFLANTLRSRCARATARTEEA